MAILFCHSFLELHEVRPTQVAHTFTHTYTHPHVRVPDACVRCMLISQIKAQQGGRQASTVGSRLIKDYPARRGAARGRRCPRALQAAPKRLPPLCGERRDRRKRRGAAGEPPSLRWRLTTAAAAAFFLSPLQACLDAHLESVINWSLDLVLFFSSIFVWLLTGVPSSHARLQVHAAA